MPTTAEISADLCALMYLIHRLDRIHGPELVPAAERDLESREHSAEWHFCLPSSCCLVASLPPRDTECPRAEVGEDRILPLHG